MWARDGFGVPEKTCSIKRSSSSMRPDSRMQRVEVRTSVGWARSQLANQESQVRQLIPGGRASQIVDVAAATASS